MKMCKVMQVKKVVAYQPCPHCNSERTSRHSRRRKVVRHINKDGPVRLMLVYSYHRCLACKRFYAPPEIYKAADIRLSASRELIDVARLSYVELGKSFAKTCRYMREVWHLDVPPTTLHDWIMG